MFRVDPAFQRQRLVCPSAGPPGPQDYEFLEVTTNRSIWILQARCVHELNEIRPWRAFFFYKLQALLQIASSEMWMSRAIHAVQPTTRSAVGLSARCSDIAAIVSRSADANARGGSLSTV